MVNTGANIFGHALRQARAADAAHREALYALSDAKSLRLRILKDELAPEVLELTLVPGDVPRLWVDLITFVVMEPDPKTYRLVQHGEGSREVLLETADRAEMVRQVKLVLAHGAISRKRREGQLRLTPERGRGYPAAALIFAGLGGLVLGVLASIGGAICLRMLPF